ncbi:MAG: beta-lactamase family protein [Gammaproteobacteria bacterium]|nr:beta-lactamase family protein [Gammaproteobacteria bacterium]
MRTFFKWFGLVLIAIVVGGWLPAYSGAYGLYWERFAASFLTNPVNPSYRWYRPLEPVAGSFTEPLRASERARGAFRPEALELAALYAKLHNSDSLIVMHGGELAFEQYWNTRKPESLFPLHSLTKTLTAILVGHAIADGRIMSADQPAWHFLPEWDDEAHRSIRIRDLLNMASGLKETYQFAPWSDRMQRVMGADIVSSNLAVGIAGPPGVKFAHINPPAQILGIIVERATGRRFADYLSEKFWRPIGARDAQVFVDRPGGTAHADCCMWAAIQDAARVGEVLRTGGVWRSEQVIPRGWVEQMTAPSAAYENFGMMVWLGNTFETERRYDPDVDAFINRQSEPFAAPTFFLDGLHLQRVWVVPSHELVIVRTGSDDPDWDESVLPNMLIRALAD